MRHKLLVLAVKQIHCPYENKLQYNYGTDHYTTYATLNAFTTVLTEQKTVV